MLSEFIQFLKIIKKCLFSIHYFVLGFFNTKEKFITYRNKFLLLTDCEDGSNSLELQFYHGNLLKLNRPINYYYDKLFDYIKKLVNNKKGGVIVRVSDGEAYFLAGKLAGNGPKRHYTSGVKMNNVALNKFKEGLLSCDSRHVEMLKNNFRSFFKIYNKNIFSDIPFECIYALISSRRLLKTDYKLGIIGSDNKIKIIKELLKHNSYCEYIGRKKFDHYVGIQETGSSNDPMKLAEDIKKQLDPNVDIYLVGIGIAKLVVLPELKKNSKNLFLDVGAGVSALAGLVSNDRPYFASWKNFRLKSFDYNKVDIMDANMDFMSSNIIQLP